MVLTFSPFGSEDKKEEEADGDDHGKHPSYKAGGITRESTHSHEVFRRKHVEKEEDIVCGTEMSYRQVPCVFSTPKKKKKMRILYIL